MNRLLVLLAFLVMLVAGCGIEDPAAGYHDCIMGCMAKGYARDNCGTACLPIDH